MLNATILCTCFLCSVFHYSSMALVYFYKVSFYSFNLIFLILCISSYSFHLNPNKCIRASVHIIICITFFIFQLPSSEQVKLSLKAELALLSLLYQHPLPSPNTRNSCFLVAKQLKKLLMSVR
jgi:hypothetical protein